MKHLTAENDFDRMKKVIALADIMLSETESVLDNKWAEFDRQRTVASHIAEHGMKNPVIVLANGDKYKFCASGARLQYAVKNGYTHIDAILVDDESEVRPLMIEQAKTEDLYLDEQYIHRWWETEAK
jgi:hypothetical protein